MREKTTTRSAHASSPAVPRTIVGSHPHRRAVVSGRDAVERMLALVIRWGSVDHPNGHAASANANEWANWNDLVRRDEPSPSPQDWVLPRDHDIVGMARHQLEKLLRGERVEVRMRSPGRHYVCWLDGDTLAREPVR